MIDACNQYKTQSPRLKIVATIFVGILLCWPVVHRCLTWQYGIDPWKYAGWAMYAVPPQRASIIVRAELASESQYGFQPEPQTLRSFSNELKRYGKLADTAAFARHLYCNTNIPIDVLIIETRLSKYNARTAFYEQHKSHHRYSFDSNTKTSC